MQLENRPAVLSDNRSWRIIGLWLVVSGEAGGTLDPAYVDRRSRLQAQILKAAAATVRSINSGSVARCEPSSKIRQICARAIKPKMVPLVMR
jgi:hypothetical protein